MGSLYSLSLLALLVVTFVDQTCGCEVKNTNDWFVERNKTPDALLTNRRILEYDTLDQDVFSKVHERAADLETILRSILKNGIPDLNVPSLDPLVYNDSFSIGETDMPGMMTIEYLELGDFEVVGLSNFDNHFLTLNILQLSLSLNLTFPIEVKAKHSNFSIIVGDLIPFNGEGPANIFNVMNQPPENGYVQQPKHLQHLNARLRVEAMIFLNLSTQGYVFIEKLSADIFFESLEVDFRTLMGVTGGKETHIFNKVMGEATPDLINLMKPYMIDGIVESLRITANEFFDSVKLSYNDILACLTGSSNCPFDLS